MREHMIQILSNIIPQTALAAEGFWRPLILPDADVETAVSRRERPVPPNRVKTDAPATWVHRTLCFTGQIAIPFFPRAFFGDPYCSFCI